MTSAGSRPPYLHSVFALANPMMAILRPQLDSSSTKQVEAGSSRPKAADCSHALLHFDKLGKTGLSTGEHRCTEADMPWPTVPRSPTEISKLRQTFR